jgi:hypothetical protein
VAAEPSLHESWLVGQTQVKNIDDAPRKAGEGVKEPNGRKLNRGHCGGLQTPLPWRDLADSATLPDCLSRVEVEADPPLANLKSQRR